MVSRSVVLLPTLFSLAAQCSALSSKAEPVAIAESVLEAEPVLNAESDSTGLTSCRPLRNWGSHLTSTVKVGIPSQKMNLVADTTFSNLVLNSCACVIKDECPAGGNCYKMSMSGTAKMQDKVYPNRPAGHQFQLGEGHLKSLRVTELVALGLLSKKLEDSVFVAARAVKSPYGKQHWDGILGLGMPMTAAQVRTSDDYDYEGRNTMQRMGVERFSVCALHGQEGTLRLNSAEPKGVAIETVGKKHWAVDLASVTVGEGKKVQPLSFCTGLAKNKKNLAGCGAVLDLATTGIEGPDWQVKKLVNNMCDEWPRCNNMAKKSSGTGRRALAFNELLRNCNSWKNYHHGIDEMPILTWLVQDTKGNQQGLVLKPKDYVMIDKHNVCSSAIGSFQSRSTNVGEVWFFGLPFFNAFTVGFDQSEEQPKISFLDGGSCDPCWTKKSNSTLMSFHRSRNHQPVWLFDGQMHKPRVRPWWSKYLEV